MRYRLHRRSALHGQRNPWISRREPLVWPFDIHKILIKIMSSFVIVLKNLPVIYLIRLTVTSRLRHK